MTAKRTTPGRLVDLVQVTQRVWHVTRIMRRHVELQVLLVDQLERLAYLRTMKHLSTHLLSHGVVLCEASFQAPTILPVEDWLVTVRCCGDWLMLIARIARCLRWHNLYRSLTAMTTKAWRNHRLLYIDAS